jgi:hypothetical protein
MFNGSVCQKQENWSNGKDLMLPQHKKGNLLNNHMFLGKGIK